MIIDCGHVWEDDNYFIDTDNVSVYKIDWDTDFELHRLSALSGKKEIPVFIGSENQCRNILKIIAKFKNNTDVTFIVLSDYNVDDDYDLEKTINKKK